MIIEIFQILFVTAILGTAITILAGVRGTVGGVDVGARAGMIVSAFVFGLWTLVAINSFDVTVVSGGEEFTRSYEQIAWVAVAGGVVALISLIQASIEEFDRTGGL